MLCLRVLWCTTGLVECLVIKTLTRMLNCSQPQKRVGRDIAWVFLISSDPALQGSSQFTTVVLDSLDTLLSDAGSPTETYKCLSDLYALAKRHGSKSTTNYSIISFAHIIPQTLASFCIPNRPRLLSLSSQRPPSPPPSSILLPTLLPSFSISHQISSYLLPSHRMQSFGVSSFP